MHAREIVGLGHADAGDVGGQGPLGLAHVGAAPEQRGAVAAGQQLSKARDGLAAVGGGRDRLGRIAGQHRQLKERRAPLALDAGDGGARLAQHRAGGGHIHIGAGAQVALANGQVVELLGQGHRAIGHLQALGVGAGVGVGAGGLGRDADPDQVLGGGYGLGAGAGRLDGAPDAAEQVDLVGDVELAIEHPSGPGRGAGQSGDQVGGGALAIGGAELDVGGGEQPRPRLLQRAPGPGEIGGGGLQVVVVGQGLLDQAVQRRIVVEAPPVRRRRRGRGHLGVGRDEAAVAGGRGRGLHVAGADGAAGQEGRRRSRTDQAPRDQASSSIGEEVVGIGGRGLGGLGSRSESLRKNM